MWLLPKIKAVGEKIRKEILDKMEQIKKKFEYKSLYLKSHALSNIFHSLLYLNFFVCEYYNIKYLCTNLRNDIRSFKKK